MPRPKGPEKVKFSVSVTAPTYAAFDRKAKDKAVGTYVADWMERQAQVIESNDRDAAPQLTQEQLEQFAEGAYVEPGRAYIDQQPKGKSFVSPTKSLARQANPNFKKGKK